MGFIHADGVILGIPPLRKVSFRDFLSNKEKKKEVREKLFPILGRLLSRTAILFPSLNEVKRRNCFIVPIVSEKVAKAQTFDVDVLGGM